MRSVIFNGFATLIISLWYLKNVAVTIKMRHQNDDHSVKIQTHYDFSGKETSKGYLFCGPPLPRTLFENGLSDFDCTGKIYVKVLVY